MVEPVKLLASLGDGDYETAIKYKLTETGEIRISAIFPGGYEVIISQAPDVGTAYWQKPHYHAGLVETYQVIRGKIGIAKLDGIGEGLTPKMSLAYYSVGESVEIPPNCQHNVCVRSGSIFTTTKIGDPVENPDRNGNDWWLAADIFHVFLHEALEEGGAV